MLKWILFTLSLILVTPTEARAKPELLSKVNYKGEQYRVYAELHFDKEKKSSDLFIDFEQGKTRDEKVAFKATTLASRLKEAQWRLQPTAPSHLGTRAILVYYGFDTKTGEYDGDHGFALITRQPIAELEEQTLDFFLKKFPKSVVNDPASGKPKYIKTILCRVTNYRVYPLIAFDVELDLPKAATLF